MSENQGIQDPTRLLKAATVPPELASRWAGASELAFGSSLADPRRYQLTTRAVGALVETLATRGPGIAVLLAAWGERHTILAELIAANPTVTIEGLDPETVAGAAFAMRHRTAAEEDAQLERAAILAQSIEPDTWVLLEEKGYGPGDPFVPYRRLEAHTPSRTAVLVTTQPDETLSDCVHLIQLLEIDPETGQLFAKNDGGARAFSEAEAREDAVRIIRADAIRTTGT